MAGTVLGLAGAAIGSFIGGPLGASIGWQIGSMAGNLLFPEHQEGPRLQDKKLHNSSYGAMIPILYGDYRFAGEVIDQQLEMTEHEHTEGGKGGPEVSTFTYTCTYAVELCHGPISNILRHWSDNKLVYDRSRGDEPLFTLYKGTEEQLPDPSLEQVHGVGNVPGYRGTAYVVFADRELGDYGNRIPSDSFEVEQVGPPSEPMRLVEWNYDRDQAYLNPVITEWRLHNGQIRVADMQTVSTPAVIPDVCYAYHEDLSFDEGTGVTETDHVPLQMSTVLLGIPYAPVGYVLNGSDMVPLWAAGLSSTVHSDGEFPSIATSDLIDPDGVALYGVDIAFVWGVPAGVNMNGVVISADRRRVIFITGPGATSDTWYEVIDGEVTRSGDVDSTAAAAGLIGYGNAGNGGWAAVGSLENDEDYIWVFSPRDQKGRVRLYKIDDTGTLRVDNDAGNRLIEPDVGGADAVNGSILTLGNGYCGVVNDLGTLAILTRLGTGGVTLAEVVTDLSIRAGLTEDDIDVTALEDDLVEGYLIARQMTVRDAVLQLQTAYFFDLVESSGVMKAVKRGGPLAAVIPDGDLAATASPDEVPALLEAERLPEEEIPRLLNVTYCNARTDYQNTTQVARRFTVDSELESSIELAVAMSDSRALQVANAILMNAWVERNTYKFSTARNWMHLEPTDTVIVRDREIRITTRRDRADGVVDFEGVGSLRSVWVQGGVPTLGTGIVPVTGPRVQPSAVLLLDIPMVDDEDAEVGFYVAMAGAVDDTWRGGQLYRSSDGGATYQGVGSTQTAATMGTASNALGDFAGGNVFDDINYVDVVIGPGGGELASANALAVLNGANKALVGEEIIQFKNAELIAGGTYRLSSLLRGRRGTDWATVTHVAGERFVMLPVMRVSTALGEIGQERLYKAVGWGRTLANTSPIAFTNLGNSLKPYAPVHLGGGSDASGNCTLNWVGRTRIGGAWQDYVEVQDADPANYVIEIWDASYTLCARIISSVTAQFTTCSAADQTTDFGAVQANVYFTVANVGQYSLGSRARGVVPSTGADDDLPLTPITPYAGPPGPPPTSTNPVNDTLAWHSETIHTQDTTGFRVGELFVVSFTTDGTPNAASNLLYAEYVDTARGRKAVLALDSGGTNVVATTYGNSSGFFFGAGLGQVQLLASTTYYVLFRCELPDGSLSGPPGVSANMVIALN